MSLALMCMGLVPLHPLPPRRMKENEQPLRPHMAVKERRKAVVEWIREEDGVYAADIAEHFGMTLGVTKKDLIALCASATVVSIKHGHRWFYKVNEHEIQKAN
jgi:hypothetical protein